MLSDAPPRSRISKAADWLAPFCLSLAAAMLAASAGGGATPSGCVAMGIAGSFIVAIVTPAFTAGFGWRRQLIVVASVLLGILGPCIVVFSRAGGTGAQVFGSVWVLVTFALAMAAFVELLDSIGVKPYLSAAAGIAAGTAWLTWPIWAARGLAERGMEKMANWLMSVHPALVINGILKFTPPWTESAIAYRLTVLDQDLPIQLPHSAVPCVVFNSLMAIALAIIGWGLRVAFHRLRRPDHQRT